MRNEFYQMSKMCTRESRKKIFQFCSMFSEVKKVRECVNKKCFACKLKIQNKCCFIQFPN